MENSGLYIHIPFCRKKCNYCDFYLVTNLNIIEKFIDSLIREIELLSEKYKDLVFDSIFIGGGTPSILSANQLGKILEYLYQYFNINSVSEITIESNPEDFFEKENKLNEFKILGINRLSIGIQSIKDNELQILSREHTGKQAEILIEKALSIFDNVSTDIIYSIPGQNADDIYVTLKKIIDFKIPHISAYTLIYEKETILYHLLKRGNIIPVDENQESEFYLFVSETFKNAGYIHYEVSNYCLNGFECRHNLKYWDYGNYIGLGPSSHSFYNLNRWNNVRNIIKYNNLLKENILPKENLHTLTSEEIKTEFIMLGLRSKGINLDKYKKLIKDDFSITHKKSIETLCKNGYAMYRNNIFSLTEKGYAIADEICAKYF